MKKLSENSYGFTVIELLVAILIISALAVVAVANIRDIRAENRDSASKTDINAIYYQLEAHYEQKGYYPEDLSESSLKGLDPDSLDDNFDRTINSDESLYSYTPRGCSEGKCKSFELTAQLEKESPYIKESLNK